MGGRLFWSVTTGVYSPAEKISNPGYLAFGQKITRRWQQNVYGAITHTKYLMRGHFSFAERSVQYRIGSNQVQDVAISNACNQALLGRVQDFAY